MKHQLANPSTKKVSNAETVKVDERNLGVEVCASAPVNFYEPLLCLHNLDGTKAGEGQIGKRRRLMSKLATITHFKPPNQIPTGEKVPAR